VRELIRGRVLWELYTGKASGGRPPKGFERTPSFLMGNQRVLRQERKTAKEEKPELKGEISLLTSNSPGKGRSHLFEIGKSGIRLVQSKVSEGSVHLPFPPEGMVIFVREEQETRDPGGSDLGDGGTARKRKGSSPHLKGKKVCRRKERQNSISVDQKKKKKKRDGCQRRRGILSAKRDLPAPLKGRGEGRGKKRSARANLGCVASSLERTSATERTTTRGPGNAHLQEAPVFGESLLQSLHSGKKRGHTIRRSGR